MRIADPARRHGMDDADIWHAVRNAISGVGSDDDEFTMVIGPARDGAPLEIGIVGLDSEDPRDAAPAEALPAPRMREASHATCR